MEATGDLVAAATELPACVEDGVNDLEGVGSRRVLAHRNAPAVVLDRDRVVAVDRDGDVVGVARHRFVDRVVDDLPHEVMEAADIGRPDVHPRPSPDGLEPFEDLDAGSVVVRAGATAATRVRHALAPTMRS